MTRENGAYFVQALGHTPMRAFVRKRPENAVSSPPARPTVPLVDCAQCGAPMHGIRGSTRAVCRNCGWKDSCC